MATMRNYRVVRTNIGDRGRRFDYPTAMTFPTLDAADEYAREWVSELHVTTRGTSSTVDVRSRRKTVARYEV